MWSKQEDTFFACGRDYASARIVLFGAPFDSTTSFRPGTRFASRAMRAEAYGLETYSPYQDLDISEAPICDAGDLELCFGDTELALKDVHDFAARVWADGKWPLLIGGEHLVTLPAIAAAKEKFPGLAAIQFDAHTDLRDDYLGARLSHAAVMRRAWELLGDGRLYQFGIRSGERQEFLWAKEHTQLTKFGFDGLDAAIAELKGRPVYLTIDLDVLDPSVFPGTGTPEAGGVSFMALMQAALAVITGCHVVGCDLVELAPAYDASGVSTATALKLLREMILAWDISLAGKQL